MLEKIKEPTLFTLLVMSKLLLLYTQCSIHREVNNDLLP